MPIAPSAVPRAATPSSGLRRVALRRLPARSGCRSRSSLRRQPRTLSALASFEFATASRVVFGRGTFSQVGSILLEGGDTGKSVFVVTGSSNRYARPLLEELAGRGVSTVTFSVSGEPSADTIVEATAAAVAGGCGSVVAIGGGSPIDTGKAVAALLTNGGDDPDPFDFLELVGRGQALTQPSARFVAVPTTAGPGAEVTRNAVIGAGDRKVSMRSPFMLPAVAVVDPELTLELPPAVTAATGLDALIQCIEPFVSSKANPVTDALALQGMKYGAACLRRAYDDGAGDIEAREGMCLCSLLGGLALANSKLGAVHGFAGVIGGAFPAPHGAVCAALLAPCTRMNLKVLEELSQAGDASAQASLASYDIVAQTLTGRPNASAEDALPWMEDLVAALDVPGLATYGLAEADVPRVCEAAAASSSMQGNPVKLGQPLLEAVLRAAM